MLYLICLYPRILISLGSYALACILASSYPYVRVSLLVSSHPYILISSGSYALVFIPASSQPHIVSFTCVSLYLRILTSSYPQVHKCLVCILVSLHPHILRFICACLYTCTPTSSYPQASEHHHILRFKFIENKLFHVNFSETLRRFNKFLIVFKNSYNPGHNILELYNVLVPVRVATGKTKLDI